MKQTAREEGQSWIALSLSAWISPLEFFADSGIALSEGIRSAIRLRLLWETLP
jgi:hypothetical protein